MTINVPEYGEIIRDGVMTQAGYDFLSEMARSVNSLSEVAPDDTLDRIAALENAPEDNPERVYFTDAEPIIIDDDFGFYQITAVIDLDAGAVNASYQIWMPNIPSTGNTSYFYPVATKGNPTTGVRRFSMTVFATLEELAQGQGKIAIDTTSTEYSLVEWIVHKYKTGD